MSARNPPSISVVIAAYNSERWLAAALDSVLAQTDPPDEIIVVDDGSTDSTPEILRAFGDVLTVIRQENAGPSAAYNRGFRESRGTYVATCASDDIWEPRKIEWQRATLAEHPGVDVSLGHARFFGLKEGEYRRLPWTGVIEASTLFEHVYWHNAFAAPTALIRRSFHESVGGYREDLPGEDYEFWLRALRAGALFHYDERILVHLRKHGSNVTADGVAVWTMAYDIHKDYAADVGDRSLVRRRLAEDQLTIGRLRLAGEDPRGARRAFVRSLLHRPTARALRWTAVLSLPGSGRAASSLHRRRASAADRATRVRARSVTEAQPSSGRSD